MSEHSVPQAPTVDEIAGRLREALVAIRDHGKTHDQPCHALHRGDCADAMQEIARAALAAVNNDPAAAPVPVSSDQSSVPGPDAPRWTRREIVDLIHEGLPIIKAYDTTIEAPRRFAEEIAAELLARDVGAAVNSDQADTAVSTDQDESVNSDRSAMPIGPERDRLIEVVAETGGLSVDVNYDDAALIVAEVERFVGGLPVPSLTSEYRVHWRWPSGHTHTNSTPLLDELRAWASSLGGEVVRVEVRETTPWRDLDEAPASALADTETTKGDDDA